MELAGTLDRPSESTSSWDDDSSVKAKAVTGAEFGGGNGRPGEALPACSCPVSTSMVSTSTSASASTSAPETASETAPANAPRAGAGATWWRPLPPAPMRSFRPPFFLVVLFSREATQRDKQMGSSVSCSSSGAREASTRSWVAWLPRRSTRPTAVKTNMVLRMSTTFLTSMKVRKMTARVQENMKTTVTARTELFHPPNLSLAKSS
mmetsp:Transcript_72766/g.229216  ORF Transcript_72766/g.229216 Transcript_72766/m.229216 type:complete len:207 (+) Transcript_72766:769-1389(+)